MAARISSLLLLCLASLGLTAQVALHGLNTPLTLSPDSTVLHPRDYLPAQKLRHVIVPQGLTAQRLDTSRLLLRGNPRHKLSTLRLVTATDTSDVLLIAADQRPVSLEIPTAPLGWDSLRIIGDFNNWNRRSRLYPAQKDTLRVHLHLAPGRYPYKLYRRGEEKLDPANLDSVPNGLGSFNNVLTVPGDSLPLGRPVLTFADSSVRLRTQEHPLQYRVFWNNRRLTVPCTRARLPTCRIAIPPAAYAQARSYLRIFSFRPGAKGVDRLIPLHYGRPVTSAAQLSRQDWHQARLYFLMVDRFVNGDTSNDRLTPGDSLHPKANYYGGDLAGVSQKLRSGYFDSTGVNTLWLSPITQNPLDDWGYWNKGSVKTTFSGYHGYWPIRSTQVDFRFGDSAAFRGLLDQAHQQGHNVLLDYVANHVHQQHPIYQKNPEWATELYLPDGSKNTEKWDSQRLTTWFDDHLPTLDLRRWEVVDPLADSALYWLTQFPLDGFRHDATKHIDELYWRTLTRRIRLRTDRPIYQVGETYGSPQLINSYLSTGMLDGQFDFNLYDAAVQTFAKSENLPQLRQTLQASLETYGYHHLMGNISGNQDRSRFISLASGDVKFDEDQKLAGWERQIGKPDSSAYRRLILLHSFNYAVPGLPVIYYGDEIGMPGANDPDNRRMMYFQDWDPEERMVYQHVQHLNRLRDTLLPLIYGDTRTEIPQPGLLKITRRYEARKVTIYLNTNPEPVSFALPGAGQVLQPGWSLDLPRSIKKPWQLSGLSALYFYQPQIHQP
jgi:glycosidase